MEPHPVRPRSGIYTTPWRNAERHRIHRRSQARGSPRIMWGGRTPVRSGDHAETRQPHRRRVAYGTSRALRALQSRGRSGESTDKERTKDRHLREHECFADFADGDAFRCPSQRSLEALDRFVKVFGAEAESLMTDRHDEMSAGFIGHFRGLFRSAMRMNPRIVSADRRDGD
jgi:hypothetical protein